MIFFLFTSSTPKNIPDNDCSHFGLRFSRYEYSFFFMIKKENLTSFLHYQEEMNYKTLTAYVLHFSIILSPKFPCKNIKRKPYLEAAVK